MNTTQIIDDLAIEEGSTSAAPGKPATEEMLRVIALGEKDRVQGKGISAAQSRAQLLAARQNRKQ